MRGAPLSPLLSTEEQATEEDAEHSPDLGELPWRLDKERVSGVEQDRGTSHGGIARKVACRK